MFDGDVVEIKLLGPVEVVYRRDRLNPGAPQQRAVLAALAVDAGRLVTQETLIDRVWGEAPPRAVRSAVHANVTLIRRMLNAANAGNTSNTSNAANGVKVDGAGGGEASPLKLLRHANGYVLDIDPDVVDVHRFGRMVSDARARGDDEKEALLSKALDLWQGPALAGLAGQWAERMRQGWSRLRLDAQVEWAHAGLRQARYHQVISAVRPLVSENCLVEPLVAVLMRALAAAGRFAEALDCYTTTRLRLTEELGIDPGPQLQALHQAILRGSIDPIASAAGEQLALEREPAVNGSAVNGSAVNGSAVNGSAVNGSAVAHSRAGWTVPRQLPALPSHFVGRATELEALCALVDRPADSSTVVLSAVAGMAGIGKTALAVHVAHRLAERYPDGQLFVDLHGYTVGVAQTSPMDVLDRLLRDVGVPGERIPSGLDRRAALWRSVVSGQRILIVLDNAATEAQVQPLLPGAARCLVLVTSRRRLTALDATHAVSLDTLPQADAVELFVRTADRPDVSSGAAEVLETVRLCGRLPLAIRPAAARLKHRRVWTVADLAKLLRDLDSCLSALDDGQRSVHAALHLSYQCLSPDAQRMYRLLGLFTGPEIELYAAAALADAGLNDTRRWLDRLADDHLLEEPACGRYRFHDLVRAHAAGTAEREESPEHQRAAMGRLLDYYRRTVSVATKTAYPYGRTHRLQVPAARTPEPELPQAQPAQNWLDTELPNLLTAARYAAENGWPEHTRQLSLLLHGHLRIRSRYRDAEALQRRALELAHRLGDRTGQVEAENGLGDVYWFLDRYRQSVEHHSRALQIAREIDDRAGQLYAQASLGDMHRILGDYELAGGYYQQALPIARAIGDRVGEQHALAGLGYVDWGLGRFELASHHLGQALQIARAIGDRVGERHALAGLAQVHWTQGRHERACDHHKQALQIAQDIGHRVGELQSLTGLGNVCQTLGRYSEAAECYRRLLDLARELGINNWQFEALQGIGRLHHATGHPDLALTYHEQALQYAIDLTPEDQARAHDGLARAHHALNQPDLARSHWQQSLELLASIGVDRAEDTVTNVRDIVAQLAKLDGGS